MPINGIKKAADPKLQTVVEPLRTGDNPEVNAKVDRYLDSLSDEMKKRIEVTPKEVFVRKWALTKVNGQEEIQEYYQSVERTLNHTEFNDYKGNLENYYKGVEDPEERRMAILRQAAQHFKTQKVKLDNGKGVKV
jgi:hypothetical protein